MELFKKLKDAEDEFVQDMLKANLVAMQSYAADVLDATADAAERIQREGIDVCVPSFIRGAARLQREMANDK